MDKQRQISWTPGGLFNISSYSLKLAGTGNHVPIKP